MEEKNCDESLREWFESYRQYYLQNHKEQQSFLDKNMLFFASAAFGFSITIFERFSNNIFSIIVLGCAWLSFTLSIITLFLSLRASVDSSQDFINQLDSNYREKKYDKKLESKSNDRIPLLNKIAFWTNIGGVVLFLVALIILLVSSTKETTMSDESKNNGLGPTKPLTEGVFNQQPSQAPNSVENIKGLKLQQPSPAPKPSSEDSNSGTKK